MIVLDTDTKVLRARLAGAITTNQPAFVMAYADKGGDLGSNAGALNSTTNVTLVAAPADGVQRVIRSGTICNIDTAAVTVILEQYDGTTARRIAKIALPVDAILAITGDSIQVIDATGAAVTVLWGGITGTLSDQTDVQAAIDAKVTSGSSPYDWIIALGDETTAITTGTKVTLRAPRALTLTKIKASLTTASSSGNPAFDVKKNGTTVFSTALTIDATEKTSETAATPAVLSTTAIAADDELTFSVSTAGTSTAGAKIVLVATA